MRKGEIGCEELPRVHLEFPLPAQSLDTLKDQVTARIAQRLTHREHLQFVHDIPARDVSLARWRQVEEAVGGPFYRVLIRPAVLDGVQDGVSIGKVYE